MVGAVIVAAGTGSRVADEDPTPKQFRRLGNRTVVQRATQPFFDVGCDPIVVVISEGERDRAVAALGELASKVSIVTGGASRHLSARRGVEACACDWVHVHDAARPFVTAELIERVQARRSDSISGVLPVMPVVETVKSVVDDTVTGTVPRSDLRLAQTPQLVHRSTYLRASDALFQSDNITDDVSVLERAGETVAIVQGEHSNRKITTADDLDPHMNGKPPMPDVRVGHGYDTHRTKVGGYAWLCGVRIEAPFCLDGHSDADVGLHALTDALLGTCGEGDIGSHFPPSDARWKDAASDQFLAQAHGIVRGKGGVITCADVTIVCEAPKIGPHRDAMRDRVSAILGLVRERVSVKATTNERVGFVGRNEGIAALATVTVLYG